MYFILFSVFACLSTSRCVDGQDEKLDHCDLLKLGLESSFVSVELSKKGFHREVITTVELRAAELSSLRVLLLHRWPRGVYVDPYQLASLRQQRDWQMLLDSAINLELPAHKTSGFDTFVFPDLVEPTPSRLRVTFPVHGRYHKPSSSRGEPFTSVNVGAPELLLRAEQCEQLSRLQLHDVVDAPCTVSNSSSCQWVKVQQKVRPIRFQVPVGDGSLVVPVCGGTLLVTMICSVALSKYMWEHRLI